MQKIRLCVGSNDGENIAGTHLGDTKYFYIYDLMENAESEFVGKRLNNVRELSHNGSEKMTQIIELVHDVQVLVARKVSPNFVKIASGTRYQPVMTSTENILQGITVLQRSFQEIAALVARRDRGERFNFIPEF